MLISVIRKLYLPIVISVALLLLSFFVREGQTSGELVVNPSILGFSLFTYKPPLSNVWVVRVVLLFSSFITFSSLMLVDFSDFFPKDLRLEVYCDPQGIRESLTVLSKEEFKELGIPVDYEQYQEKYYDDVNITLRDILKKNKDTVYSGKNIHSKGEIKFTVKKVDGIQNYYVEDSRGRLDYTLEKPNTPQENFLMLIEKKGTQYDHISPSLKDIFIKHAVVIQPRFKQIFSKDLNSKSFDHALVCATKVYFFPYPRLSKVMYMVDYGDTGRIPIGYGVYW